MFDNNSQNSNNLLSAANSSDNSIPEVLLSQTVELKPCTQRYVEFKLNKTQLKEYFIESSETFELQYINVEKGLINANKSTVQAIVQNKTLETVILEQNTIIAKLTEVSKPYFKPNHNMRPKKSPNVLNSLNSNNNPNSNLNSNFNGN